MTPKTTLIASGIILATALQGQATVIGFGQIGGSNAAVGLNFASNVSADGNGFVVTNGATPNIGLTWGGSAASPTDSSWDIHTSNFFTPIENQTVGGGAWDNEGSIPRIAQLDFGNHTIAFAVDEGFALSLNSFDFGHTAETAGTATWDLTLTDSSLNVVWSQSVSLTNTTTTISPGFTGSLGEDYLLTFNRTSETYNTNGRHGLDNLNFTQVPEPASAFLAGLSGLAFFLRRRR
ncbi:PEP-CTERM sorting domain-containing protein [Luteolibacter marinus]|uniref:PEP-CTERM sorting domain-containing protein n=1 Tax=Luteolibacter marinus TaxID=2776705 RepID=UPI001866EB38|nr:PEP-CTERM sorting domain-containing protein [Luteolibacter marinus]